MVRTSPASPRVMPDKIIGTGSGCSGDRREGDAQEDVPRDSALLASLDDMLILHPDVNNLSLGCGRHDNEADTVYATVYKKLQDAGITVNAPGNAFSTGYGNNLACPTPRLGRRFSATYPRWSPSPRRERAHP